ncbi:MAG: type II toxin-antitoxin system HicB family antitoxin [Chloroflexi bacterium]|nr:type II toxin-antitoxin system HicB family antitoxin [Chloroflexota bacterium]
MTTRRFKVLLEWDPEAQAWVSYVPVLNHLSTFGESREQAVANTREAILGYLEAAEKEGIPVPEPDTEPELVDVEVAIA